MCHWQHNPCDMYINLYAISLVYFSVDIVASKRYLRYKFKAELKFICAEFRIFSTFSKRDITILMNISHGNRSLTSYTLLNGSVAGNNFTLHSDNMLHNITYTTKNIIYIIICDTCNMQYVGMATNNISYLLPWPWHILCIPLETIRGISAETCRLNDVFPPADLGSGP